MKWNNVKYATLDELRERAGIEKHGVIVGLDIFAAKLDFPAPDKAHEPPDLRLKPGSRAVDAGQILPNVNDGFQGKAPDLGAYELGDPLPLYGPRPEPGP
jgi:hypothetical protein